MTNFELIAEAIELMNAGNNKAAAARLRQFTALNTPKVKVGGKVKIYDWTNPKEYHACGRGVYHDAAKGVAVATETHVLLVSKPDYNANLAGKCIDKKGDVIDIPQYVLYESVIPQKDLVECEVNRERIAELLSEMRAEKKINKDTDYFAFNISDKANPIYIRPAFCKLLLTLPAEGKFYFSDPNRPLLYKSDNGDYTAVIMPVSVKDDFIGMEKVTYDGCKY